MTIPVDYIGAICVNGAVRLIGGLVPTEGTVQVCVDGMWRELCYSGWGYQEAFVVCRQLGLPATGECDMTQKDISVVIVIVVFNLMHFYCFICRW